MIFKIHSPKCVRLAAGHLRAQLEKLGHDAYLVDEIDAQDKSLYIIYAAGTVKHLPKNYIVYQTEVHSSAWFTPKYFNIISRAVCIWEYSEANISKYEKYNNRIAVVSPGMSKLETPDKDGGILFYGWIQGSKRRESILQNLSNQIKINIVTNTLEGEMWYLLSRAKVVLNLHYYENAPIEAFRINEALSFNCHVVSERSANGDDKYKGLVHFAHTGNMVKLLTELRDKPFNTDVSRLNNLKEIKQGVKLLKTCSAQLHQ